MSNILIYKLTLSSTGFSATVSQDSQTQATYSGISMSLSLYGISFQRKIYEPGHIQAELLITTSKDKTVPMETLSKMLLDVPAQLSVIKDGTESTIATGYYIYEISPQFEIKDNNCYIYVKLDMFSKDKLLTLNKFSKAYRGKKLIGEIVKDFVGHSSIGVTLRPLAESQLQKLGYTSGTSQEEYIQPYIVQYNESFHDFLKRTSNRCGEAFYFENGKLCFGLKSGATSTPVSDARRIIFQSISAAPLTVRDYARDTVKEINSDKKYDLDEDTLITDPVPYCVDFPKDAFPMDRISTDLEYTEVYNSEISSEDYYVILYKNKFAKDNYWDLLWGDTAEHLLGWLSESLNTTSLLDLLSKHIVKTEAALIRSGVKFKETTKKGNAMVKAASLNGSDDDTYAVLFSKVDNLRDHWVTLDYYHNIRCKEEAMALKTVCVDMGDGFKDVKLGDKITIPGDTANTYVVIQIDMSSASEWKRSYEGFDSDPTPSGGTQSQRFFAIPMDGTVFFPPLLPGKPFRRSGPQPAFITEAGDPLQQGRVRIRFAWQPSYGVREKESDADAKYETLKNCCELDDKNNIKKNDDGTPKRKDSVSQQTYKAALDAYNDSLDKVDAARGEIKKDASPWIRMATPMATRGGGMYFRPELGDEVMVDFENGNVDRPYVVGTLYSKNVTAPTDGNRVIVSPNGHTIKMTDPKNAADFVAGTYPGIQFLKSVGMKFDGWDLEGDELKMLGGIEFTDKYGLYNIKMSSSDRSISISSPFGDVGLSALTGITIEAPNGDISIKGKNIDITAFNKVTISSGKNIKNNGGLFGRFKPFADMDSLGKAAGKTLTGLLGGKFMDLSLLRTLLEIIIRPIDGTLQIKSGRFLQLEAGRGKTVPDAANYEVHWPDRIFGKHDPFVLKYLATWLKARLKAFVSQYIFLFNEIEKNLKVFNTANLLGANSIALSTPASKDALVSAIFGEAVFKTAAETTSAHDFVDDTTKIDFVQNANGAMKTMVKGGVWNLMCAINNVRKYIEGYEDIFDAPNTTRGAAGLIKYFLTKCPSFTTDAKLILKLDNPFVQAGAAPTAPPVAPIPSPTPTLQKGAGPDAGLYGGSIKKIENYGGDSSIFVTLQDDAFDDWIDFVYRRLMCLVIEKCRNQATNPIPTFFVAPATYAPTVNPAGQPVYNQPSDMVFPFDRTDWDKYVADIRFLPLSPDTTKAQDFGGGLVDSVKDAFSKLNFIPEISEMSVWSAVAQGEILFSDKKGETYQFKSGGVESHVNQDRLLSGDEDEVHNAIK